MHVRRALFRSLLCQLSSSNGVRLHHSATQQKIDKFAYDQVVTEVRIDLRGREPILHPTTKEPFGWKKKVLGLLNVRSTDKSSSVAEPAGLDEEPKPDDVVVLRPAAGSQKAR